MSVNQSPPFNNWVKCSEGLIECCREAATIVQHVMDNWHQVDIQPKTTDFKCTGSPPCKPNLKPKKARGHCDQCVKWADIVIPKLLAPCAVPNKSSYEVYWQHAKSSDYYECVIEVAKLFGLKNISADALTDIKKFDDFDSAWLLSIMEKVKLFDRNDVLSQVQNITEIRNTIMHRPVGHAMTDLEMQIIFQAYSKLVSCFKDNFTFVTKETAEGLQARLKKIQDMSIVTTDMVQRTVTMFLKEVETWKMEQGADIKAIQESLEAVCGICQAVPELHDQMVDVKKVQGKLEERVGILETDMESIKEQYDTLTNQTSVRQQQSEDSGYSTSLSPTSTSATSPVSNGTSMDSNSESEMKSTQSRPISYDLLLVHSEHDMETKLYTDLTEHFEKNDLSYISMHEKPMGGDVFKTFEDMLEDCSWTMCLITDKFMKDVWCHQSYVQVCERAVRKQDESVLYVKAAGFRDDDMPAGLKGVSGLKHPSKFFTNVLKNTFKKLRKLRAEKQGTAAIHSSTPSTCQNSVGHQAESNTVPVIQGSNNVLVNAGDHSVINIYQGIPAGKTTADVSNNPSAPMGQQPSSESQPPDGNKESSVGTPIKCSESQPAGESTESSVGTPTECSESNDQEKHETNKASPSDSKDNKKSSPKISEPSLANNEPAPENTEPAPKNNESSPKEEPPYKDLVSLDPADNKDDQGTGSPSNTKLPSSLTNQHLLEETDDTQLPSSLTNQHLLKVQDASIESAQLKKYLSSPDIPTAIKDETKSENEPSTKSKQRLSSSSEPLPFVSYHESFKPVFNKGETVEGTTGLKNLGNTCYMNSALQCLSNATILAQYFTDGEYESTRAKPEGRVAEEFAKIMSALWLGKYQYIYPTDLFNAVCDQLPMFNGDNLKGRQHDAHEFLNELIEEGLHKDLNQVEEKQTSNTKEEKAGDDTNDSPPEIPQIPDEELSNIMWNRHIDSNQSVITRLFQGQLRSVVKCQGCKHKSSTFEPFTILTVPLPSSKKDLKLQECLEEFSKKEELHGENAYSCDKCNRCCNASKRMDIWRLPKILVICLKRFTPQLIGKTVFVNKNETLVKFPLTELNISKFTSGPKPMCSYHLFAVTNHTGTTKGGHYTAYCQNASNKKWYCFNDNSVQDISADNIQSSKAYLLFYTCVDLMPPL